MAEGPFQRPLALAQSSPGGGASARDEWVTVGTAPDQLTAELWRQLLLSEGVPATIAPGDTFLFLGVSPAPCRLQVPASQLKQAEAILQGEPQGQQEEG